MWCNCHVPDGDAAHATSISHRSTPQRRPMQMHASCAARHGQGVLVLGPPGSGKTTLILELIAAGFVLVADDRVDVTEGVASGPPALAGLIEVRGLGVVRLPYLRASPVCLTVRLGLPERVPAPRETGREIIVQGPGMAAAVLQALRPITPPWA